MNAPWNDLALYKDILKYKEVNSTISSSAQKAFKRHFWYLTAEMVTLSLFSDIVPSEELRYLADCLLAVQATQENVTPTHRYGRGLGKPKFPDVSLTTRLGDLVNEDSWFLFGLLQLDRSFLEENVENWKELPTFANDKKKIGAITVINDCAERGVKLSSDFLAASTTEKHYQNVLQVVEQDRKNKPNLRK